MLLVIAVPLIQWFRPRHSEVIGVWMILGAVVLAVAASAALRDARELRHYNCWKLSEHKEGSTTVQRIACAPGSEPEQWSSSGEHDPGQRCDYVDPAEDRAADASERLAQVTIWYCE